MIYCYYEIPTKNIAITVMAGTAKHTKAVLRQVVKVPIRKTIKKPTMADTTEHANKIPRIDG